jgi:hypothetical protein
MQKSSVYDGMTGGDFAIVSAFHPLRGKGGLCRELISYKDKSRDSWDQQFEMRAP